MTPEIQNLIDRLQLQPHIEGGYYRETYRSGEKVVNLKGESRDLATLIYFLLPSRTFSQFHRIASDEIWLYQQGAPVAIHFLLEDGNHRTEILGSDSGIGHQLQVIVPANTLFGAEVLGDNTYALAACMVSPGFDFSDFQLYSKDALMELYPRQHKIIAHLHQ